MMLKPKRRGFSLEMRTFKGTSGMSYPVFRSREGSFHVFQEVEAKDAAADCGARRDGNTRHMWKKLWGKL